MGVIIHEEKKIFKSHQPGVSGYLIPLCFYCLRGIDKGMHVLKGLCLRRKTDAEESSSGRLFTFCYAALTLVIVVALCVTVYGYVFPYYAKF